MRAFPDLATMTVYRQIVDAQGEMLDAMLLELDAVPEFASLSTSERQKVRSQSHENLRYFLASVVGKVPVSQPRQIAQVVYRSRRSQGVSLQGLISATGRCVGAGVAWVYDNADRSGHDPVDDGDGARADIVTRWLRYTSEFQSCLVEAWSRQMAAATDPDGWYAGSSLVGELVSGNADESDLAANGLSASSKYVAIVIGFRDPDQPGEKLTDDPERLAFKLRALAANTNAKNLLAMEDNRLLCIMGSQAFSGSRLPSALVQHMDSVATVLNPGVVVGVGGPSATIQGARHAYLQAELALRRAQGSRQDVVYFDRMSTFDRVIVQSIGSVAVIVPTRVEQVLQHDANRGAPLLATAQAYFDSGLNILETARRLGVHPNTVYYRLRHGSDLLDVNLRKMDGLLDFLMMAEISGMDLPDRFRESAFAR